MSSGPRRTSASARMGRITSQRPTSGQSSGWRDGSARESGLQALEAHHRPLAPTPSRGHDAELAGQVVQVIEGAITRNPAVAHRPLVDPLDPDPSPRRCEAGGIELTAVSALHRPGPHDDVAGDGEGWRVRLGEAKVGEGATAGSQELLNGCDAARR